MNYPLRATHLVGTAIVVALLGSACATAAPLETKESTSRIHAAEELGAADVPQAKLQLQLAKEGLARAEELASDGEREQANSMLTRAEADAQLAVVLSHEDAERKESLAAVERVRQLRISHDLPVQGDQP